MTLAALAVLVALARAHSDEFVKFPQDECTCEPGAKAFESFHIHVLFFPDPPPRGGSAHKPPSGNGPLNNTHSSVYAKALRNAFIEATLGQRQREE